VGKNCPPSVPEGLTQAATKGKSGARKIRRARILLLAEEGYIETEHRKNLESRTSNRTFAKLLGI
jgi:hypothetical protein